MKIIDEVRRLSNEIVNHIPNNVILDDEAIKDLAKTLKSSELAEWKEPQQELDKKKIEEIFLYELIANSVNYCYWYGKSDIRPNQASSSTLYKLLYDSFATYNGPHSHSFDNCLDKFIKSLIINRFPLVEDRIRHLNELREQGEGFSSFLNINHKELKFEYNLENLIETFPGFAGDVFLKRASLFFIQLYRKLGWFEHEMKYLHVPADYQIPKVLNSLDCISYDDDLGIKIFNNMLIQKNSLMECEIRAATILTIKRLCELTGWNVSQIDTFFFKNRNKFTNTKFHLTITTDY